mmetsp:Transcript_58446/g.137584  ORF Transcript_58446/g.137584 Transcript_58446/m.137584 type:complete len:201 (+) Transcript_58446:435-1037(+)
MIAWFLKGPSGTNFLVLRHMPFMVVRNWFCCSAPIVLILNFSISFLTHMCGSAAIAARISASVGTGAGAGLAFLAGPPAWEPSGRLPSDDDDGSFTLIEPTFCWGLEALEPLSLSSSTCILEDSSGELDRSRFLSSLDLTGLPVTMRSISLPASSSARCVFISSSDDSSLISFTTSSATSSYSAFWMSSGFSARSSPAAA